MIQKDTGAQVNNSTFISTSYRVFWSPVLIQSNTKLLDTNNARAGLDNYTKSDLLILNLRDTVEPQLSTKATLETEGSGRYWEVGV